MAIGKPSETKLKPHLHLIRCGGGAFSLGWRQVDMADDLKDTIQQNAEGPKQASADGVNVQQHSLGDQIAADKYLASKQAASKNPAKAFTRVKVVPPGTV